MYGSFSISEFRSKFHLKQDKCLVGIHTYFSRELHPEWSSALCYQNSNGIINLQPIYHGYEAQVHHVNIS